MSEKHRRGKALTILLTESAVYLRPDRASHSRRSRSSDSRPSLLRGLLVLDLDKPSRITSIELELTAKTTVSWPEGVGARRMEVTEELVVYRSSIVYFSATSFQARRTSSLGPGSAYLALDEYSDRPATQLSRSISSPRNRPAHNVTTSPQIISRGGSVRCSSSHSPSSHYNPAFNDLSARRPESIGVPSLLAVPRTTIAFPSSGTYSTDNILHSPLIQLRQSTPSTGSISQNVTPSCSPVRSLRVHNAGEDVSPSEITFLSSRRGRSSSSRPSPVSNSPELPSEDQQRANSRSRFRLSSVSTVLEAVKSSYFERLEQQGEGFVRHRGRSQVKRRSSQECDDTLSRSKERSTLEKLSDILKPDYEVLEARERWEEFRTGTYTYPISFEIPASSPPTILCQYGSVKWRLQAIVHRPGTFTPKLTASCEVIVVVSPADDFTEANENLGIERLWEQHLQYLISVTGNNFFIGGVIPVTITLSPFSKVKVHRLTLQVEERIEYYTKMRRLARTDPLSLVELLDIKKEPGDAVQYILPLESDVSKKSPFYALLSRDNDLLSKLMGPGPWTLHWDLRLPRSCSFLHFSNKNRKSNILITHHLICMIRVESCDDEIINAKTGKQKFHDIIVRHPINILSCRCSPEWSSLPRYSEALVDDSSAVVLNCPCTTQPTEFRAGGQTASRQSGTESCTPSARASRVVSLSVSPLRPSSLQSRQNQYARLISGQESEAGEVPPAYVEYSYTINSPEASPEVT